MQNWWYPAVRYRNVGWSELVKLGDVQSWPENICCSLFEPVPKHCICWGSGQSTRYYDQWILLPRGSLYPISVGHFHCTLWYLHWGIWWALLPNRNSSRSQPYSPLDDISPRCWSMSPSVFCFSQVPQTGQRTHTSSNACWADCHS